MAEQTIYKIRVEAMLLDDTLKKRDAFRQWEYDYKELNQYASPEPNAYDRQYQQKEKGIYLRWILPRSIRTRQEGETEFPYIPNRWLITRVADNGGEKISTSWVLESDCPVSMEMKDDPGLVKETKYASQYLVSTEELEAWKDSGDRYRMQPKIFAKAADGHGACLKMGIRFDADTWKERFAGDLVIRSCAPGNPVFSAYTGHNSNMLSVYDDLNGVTDGTVSYIVCGWYSSGFENCFFSGNISGILWSDKGVPQDQYADPLRELEADPSLKVILAEDTGEALRMGLRQALSGQMTDSQWQEDEMLLAAMQKHMTGELQKIDGNIKVSNAIYDEQFLSSAGERAYSIADGSGAPVVLAEEEQDFLSFLHSFEDNVRNLKRKRQRVFELWWKKGHLQAQPFTSVSVKPEDFDAALDARKTGSLMNELVEQYQTVVELYRRLLGYECRLQEGHELKTVPGPRFYRKKNPSVLIEGVEAPADMEQEPDEQYSISDASAGQELPAWGNRIPKTAARLYQDQLWKITQGQGEKWAQPWQPLFLEWRVTVNGNGSWKEIFKNWSFNGTLYESTGQQEENHQWTYGGIAMLDQSHISHAREQLMQSASQLADEEKQRAESLLKMLGGIKLLGQELSGLRELSAQTDYRSFRQPFTEKIQGTDYTLEELLGFTGADAQFLDLTGGGADHVPYMRGENVPEFSEILAGTGQICDLSLYDAFGRVLHLICSEQRSGLKRADDFSVIVSERMDTGKKNRFYLTPALVQEARLEMHLPTESGHNPVAGFLVPSILDHAMLVYDREGEYLGDIAVRVNESGVHRVCFAPGVGSQKPQGILADAVNGFVSYEKNTDGFAALLDKIDRTFCTMDPAGVIGEKRIRLLGRPLALTEMDLWIEPEKEWRHDIGWDDTGQEVFSSDLYETGSIPVCLGDLQLRSDGLVGYFVNGRYDTFYFGAEQTEELPFGKERRLSVVLLMDPSGSVHGYTGFFPVKEIFIPARYTAEPLKKMGPRFRVSACLTARDESGIRMPDMKMPGCDAEWLEYQEETEETVPVLAADSSIVLNGMEQSVREGFLLFTSKQNDNK